MHIRLILTMALAIIAAGGARAIQRVSLGDASAGLLSEAEVSVSYTASESDAVAMDIRIPLPEGMSYVAGSAIVTGERLSGHTMEAGEVNGELRILIFSFSHAPIAAGEGEILRFTLKSGSQPERYSLLPRVKLGAASGAEIPSEAVGSIFTVLAPRMALGGATVDYGRVPIRSSYRRSFTVTNTGTMPLTVTSIEAPAGEPYSFSPSRFTVEAGSSKSVEITYSPMEYADSLVSRVKIYSDASNGVQTFIVRSVPYSVNELSVLRAYGTGGEETTVALKLANMEPIAGADITMTLPDCMEYVEGSLECAPRAAALSPRATMSGQELRIVLFSLANSVIPEGDDTICTFRLHLKGSSGWYSLYPGKVRLANIVGRDMTSAAYGEYVVIRSGEIACESSLDMGHTSAVEGKSSIFTVRNAGEAPLTITRAAFLAEGFGMTTPLPVTIAPGGSTGLEVNVAPREKGDYATTMLIYSDDPATPVKQVEVKGISYSPNALVISGEPAENYDAYTLTCSLNNHSPIVALQMDITASDTGLTTSSDSLRLSTRSHSHQSAIQKIAAGHYRLVIFSLANAPFDGDNGEIFRLSLASANDPVGTTLTFSDIKLCTASGENFTTPGAHLIIHDICGVEVDSIELSHTDKTLDLGETHQLTASVYPRNAYRKGVVWRSENPAIATVSEDGLVTGIATGETKIVATSQDSLQREAQCMVTVTNVETGMAGIQGETLKVTVTPGTLRITGAMCAALYSLDGSMIASSAECEIVWHPAPGIYLVKAAGQTLKVVMP